MIFTGDIALPLCGLIKIKQLDKALSEKQWIGNLEGSLLDEDSILSNNPLSKRKVFNSLEAVSELCHTLNFKAFNIANNHLLDACNCKETIQNLRQLDIPFLGGGTNLNEAQKPLLMTDEGNDYVILSFGWNAIRCRYANENKEGVNPYTRKNVMDQVSKVLSNYPNRRIILFFHWNYELEVIPQPMDREFAHKLIDMGVYAVIGCHAHRVQPIEIYKGQPIVYGLGNFAFPSKVYMDGTLGFPDFSEDEIAFEIKGDGTFAVHKFNYNRQSLTLCYLAEEEITPAIFEGMSDNSYKKYFKKNKFKGKGLPIFYYSDSDFIYKMKVNWVKLRDHLIFFLIKNKNIIHKLKNSIFK